MKKKANPCLGKGCLNEDHEPVVQRITDFGPFGGPPAEMGQSALSVLPKRAGDPREPEKEGKGAGEGGFLSRSRRSKGRAVKICG